MERRKKVEAQDPQRAKKDKSARRRKRARQTTSDAARALCSDERIQKDNEARARREGKGKRRISKNR
jgi:hypothetical protein